MDLSALSSSLQHKAGNIGNGGNPRGMHLQQIPPRHGGGTRTGAVTIPSRSRGKKATTPRRNIAGSCPTFELVPRAPASRPSAPSLDPPQMLLPPSSPDVFGDLDLTGEEDDHPTTAMPVIAPRAAPSRPRARSLTFGASCPDANYFGSRFGPIDETQSPQPPQPVMNTTAATSPQPPQQLQVQYGHSSELSPNVPERGSISIRDTTLQAGASHSRRTSLDAGTLGKSPTIFSLLQTGQLSENSAAALTQQHSHSQGVSGSVQTHSHNLDSVQVHQHENRHSSRAQNMGLNEDMMTSALGKNLNHQGYQTVVGFGLPQETPPTPEEPDGDGDLMFSISFDPNDQDGFLANTMKDDLHL